MVVMTWRCGLIVATVQVSLVVAVVPPFLLGCGLLEVGSAAPNHVQHKIFELTPLGLVLDFPL